MTPPKKTFLEIIFLVIVSAIVYLPDIGRLTYFKDEWYFIYDAYVAGADVFRYMFSVDRPARGIFFEVYYSLFGPQALYYHIGGYLWRVIGMLGALWLFNMLWPGNRKFAYFTALLFVLYPGYFWWISAVEYQPHIASLALQVVSIALTLKVIQSSKKLVKASCGLGAILTGWAYIALVDYAIGMEAVRFLCVVAVVSRDERLSNTWKRLVASIRAWSWNLLIPLGVVWWRIFIFSNERKATDIGYQMGVFFSAPVLTVSTWASHYFSSLFNLGILAWVGQFQNFFFTLTVIDMVYGSAVAVLVLLLVFLINRRIQISDAGVQAAGLERPAAMLGREALFIGVLGMIFGILPVILANRYINLGIYSHYSLPASLPAVMFLAGLLSIIKSSYVRETLFSIIIVLAVLAQYAIPKHTLKEENAIETYWWQASWRVPGLRPDATLVTLYPNGIGGVDNNFMETANLIYFPDRQQEVPVRYNVSALLPTDQNAERIIGGEHRKKDKYRSHTFILNYSDVLVLSQPTSSSCVHVINGRRYLLSESDPENIRLIAPYSRIEIARVGVEPRRPPEFAFGPEPEHTWCYYFEKADLAVQKLEWKEAAVLGDDALSLELHPEDPSEWFPFLQAYGMTGDEGKVRTVSARIIPHEFLRDRLCLIFNQPDSELSLSPQMKTLVNDLFCK